MAAEMTDASWSIGRFTNEELEQMSAAQLEQAEADWGEHCDACGWCDTPGQCIAAHACPTCGSAPKSLCRDPENPARLVKYHDERWALVPKRKEDAMEEKPVGKCTRDVTIVEYEGKRYIPQRKRSRGRVFCTALDGRLLTDAVYLHPSTPVRVVPDPEWRPGTTTTEEVTMSGTPDPKPESTKRSRTKKDTAEKAAAATATAEPKAEEPKAEKAEAKKNTIDAGYTRSVVNRVEKGLKYSEIEVEFDKAEKAVPDGFKTHYPAIRKAALDHFGSVQKVNETRGAAKLAAAEAESK